jgi:MFS family permease
VLGGVFAQFLGWRSIFWFLTTLAAIFLAPFCILFPETARKVVGDGSIPPQSWNVSLFNYQAAKQARMAKNDLECSKSKGDQRAAQRKLASKRKLRWPNPLTTLRVIFQKDVGLLLFYNGIIYTSFMDLVASAPYLLQQIYGFNDLQIGLCFIPFGVGCLIAPPLSGRWMDWNYARTARRVGFRVDKKRGDILTAAFPLERARFEIAGPMVAIGCAAMLAYGWAMEAETNLAMPLILHFIIGLCLNGGFNAQSVLLVDLYPMSPATATAANNLVRCWMGAGGTALIILMIDSMGRGWCFTFIALVVVALSPILWVLVRWGPTWREERRSKDLRTA